MRKLMLTALATGMTLLAVSPAMAAEGCGPGGHRGPRGHCRPNGGGVVVAPGGALVVDRFYAGRGYWDGRRYWQHRRHWHGGWRYY